MTIKDHLKSGKDFIVNGKLKFLPNTNGNWIQWFDRPWHCELPLINLVTGEDPIIFTMSMWIKTCKK